MSSSVPTQSQRRLQPENIRGLLVHVDAEEVSLRNTMRLLRDIPIYAADEVEQRELRGRIEQSLQHAEFLFQNRCKVTSSLGQYLGMPAAAVSFSSLIPHATPEAAALLLASRQRLHRLVQQVQVLANAAAWIVGESRRIQLTVLESLPGTVSSDRYDSAGHRSLNPASFRFETRS